MQALLDIYMAKNSRHVVPSPSGWSVVKAGASRASRTFEKQSEAISYGKEQAKKNNGDLYVHRKSGTIRDRTSYKK
jgi:hypothetical protein